MQHKLLILFLIVSCSHIKIPKERLGDTVTLNAAINIARAAYMNACLKHSPPHVQRYNHCRIETDEFINSNVSVHFIEPKNK